MDVKTFFIASNVVKAKDEMKIVFNFLISEFFSCGFQEKLSYRNMRWPKQLILLFAAKLICSSSANLILPGAKKDNGGNLKVKFEKFTPPRYSWTGTNVRFPTDEIRNDYLDNGKFIMKNSIQSKFQVFAYVVF